jgi:hypothetical protein
VQVKTQNVQSNPDHTQPLPNIFTSCNQTFEKIEMLKSPSTKTVETPIHFNVSLHIDAKIRQLKKMWFTVASLPQPPTQYNNEFNLTPFRFRLSLMIIYQGVASKLTFKPDSLVNFF